jgi:hypothetical protein
MLKFMKDLTTFSIFSSKIKSRKTNLYGGRSINLALSNRGFNALEKALNSKEIVDKVKEAGVKVFSRFIHQ